MRDLPYGYAIGNFVFLSGFVVLSCCMCDMLRCLLYVIDESECTVFSGSDRSC